VASDWHVHGKAKQSRVASRGRKMQFNRLQHTKRASPALSRFLFLNSFYSSKYIKRDVTVLCCRMAELDGSSNLEAKQEAYVLLLRFKCRGGG
jgi:hypothetical protein